MTWRGIIGRSFLTVESFAHYVDTVQFGIWRPKFVVVHNTSAPDIALYNKWQARGHPTDEQWMQNLVGYYRDQQKWSAGPHLFVTPRSICVFSPLSGPGTHSPAWNSISWGVETVGEFDREPFKDGSRDNLIGALGVLHMKAGLSLRPYLSGHTGLHFHKEDPRTTHKNCPGKHMVKADLVAAVEQWIEARHDGDHKPPALAGAQQLNRTEKIE